jgi:hypothetical protein
MKLMRNALGKRFGWKGRRGRLLMRGSGDHGFPLKRSPWDWSNLIWMYNVDEQVNVFKHPLAIQGEFKADH